jgi:hypothetical protein
VRDTIIHISTYSSSNEIQGIVVVLIPLQLTLGCIIKCCGDDVSFLYDLKNGTSMAQKIVVSPVFPITKILAIIDNELHGTFLHIAFGSESLLRTTSDLIDSDTN